MSGNLSANNCQELFGPGTRTNRYTFTATAGQAIAISVNSSEFDTYLTLTEPDGGLIGLGGGLFTPTGVTSMPSPEPGMPMLL